MNFMLLAHVGDKVFHKYFETYNEAMDEMYIAKKYYENKGVKFISPPEIDFTNASGILKVDDEMAIKVELRIVDAPQFQNDAVPWDTNSTFVAAH